MRLDVFLFEKGYADSRTEAKNFILDGAVKVGEKIITKPAFELDENGLSSVSIDKSGKKYVSRGGLKLEFALEKFSVDVNGALAIDVGASSGGFTDCLLKNGATRVIAVDAGTGQLNPILAKDLRVTSYENFNARYMKREDFDFIPNICVMDVSFISATLIIPAIYDVLDTDGVFICLIKPQFEVGRKNVGKGGIVKDAKVREAALKNVISFAENTGFAFLGYDISPILGGDGNTEYLACFKKY